MDGVKMCNGIHEYAEFSYSNVLPLQHETSIFWIMFDDHSAHHHNEHGHVSVMQKNLRLIAKLTL